MQDPQTDKSGKSRPLKGDHQGADVLASDQNMPASEEKKEDVQPAEFQSLQEGTTGELREKKIDLLMDISLPVTIELGRTSMMIKDIIVLQKGSIVEFDRAAGEPVDILINGKKMAEGEVVVVEQHFGVRITSLVDAPERIKV